MATSYPLFSWLRTTVMLLGSTQEMDSTVSLGGGNLTHKTSELLDFLGSENPLSVHALSI